MSHMQKRHNCSITTRVRQALCTSARLFQTQPNWGLAVTIDAGAHVEENVSLGDRVWIGAGAFRRVKVHRLVTDTVIKPGAGDLSRGEKSARAARFTRMRRLVPDGFGFAPAAEGWIKIQQLASGGYWRTTLRLALIRPVDRRRA
jgi:UDP-3-O-[3-hydroxymyristoyl] glucosamine N-acyltransferase